jgi:CHAD domain-containing protein
MTQRTILRDYAMAQMDRLLTSFAQEAEKAAKYPVADAVHDVRVSIRRFSQGLLLFPEFFPKREARKIKKRLDRIMNLSSEVRNRDIALEYLGEDADPKLLRQLRDGRDECEKAFSTLIQRWSEQDVAGKWRAGLGLRHT